MARVGPARRDLPDGLHDRSCVVPLADCQCRASGRQSPRVGRHRCVPAGGGLDRREHSRREAAGGRRHHSLFLRQPRRVLRLDGRPRCVRSVIDFAGAAEVVERGVGDRAFPAAVVEVGSRDGVLWQQAFGRLDHDADAAVTRADTIFDLASLTKVIATTSLVMRLVERGTVRLNHPIRNWIPEWRGNDREHVTVRSLLSHSSGLTAWLPFFRDHTGRQEFQHAICSLPLEYQPDTQSIYSDLGFILLGFIVEDAGGGPFQRQAEALLSELTAAPLLFNPPADLRASIAPTENDPWRGRRLIGEVHDENCWALGGAAGHAGLFGTAAAVGDFARAILGALNGSDSRLATPKTARTFVTRAGIPGSRALGWDTMLPTSSCGTKMSASAFGHTGFTGTTLWIDPERGIYVVFLTNRVNPTRENTTIQRVRPALHDAVIDAVDGA
ncbi:MAG: class A beta-lactamase-related serine hydrolase [Acidobacteria bacterium]|nr:MAG: class A beta-lactamase-related serine hydrolase [Acidobacteriota bacterium]